MADAANTKPESPAESDQSDNVPTTSSSSSSTKGLSVGVDKPSHRLDARTWLHDRPEEDVYKLLVDTYRLRMEDNYKRPGLLPPWLSPEKAAECVAFGMNQKDGGWSDLSRAIEKSNVIEHYGNPTMPMQLRMFGEQVYGRGPGEHDGTQMRKTLMMVENGDMVAGQFSAFAR
ncbi:hypothetical protein VTN77DRAFT_8188 [Rasamsonia byssochlamydoides]|uniref:uncharacterized protein n=1 Tax=Rasamsonia byssochlamydoides TaxID=89139 RepID=UPI0037444022